MVEERSVSKRYIKHLEPTACLPQPCVAVWDHMGGYGRVEKGTKKNLVGRRSVAELLIDT
jgi:hypothetical protein